jgi:hypothetical protein
MRSLERLRDEPLLGEVAFMIDGDQKPRPLLFHAAANTAYFLTVDALRNFEQSDAIGSGPFVVPGIAFWFLATESYISTVYKAASEVNAAPEGSPPAYGRLKRTSHVIDKLVAIKDWAAGDADPPAPRNRLQDFAAFRNALFHDLTSYDRPPTQYAHSRFSPRAEKCNQVDLFEAMRISLEVFEYLRHLFATADLMPSIQLGPVVEKLDTLAAEVLEPAFAEILAAKELTARRPPTNLSMCPAELPIPLQFVISHQGPTAPTKLPGRSGFVIDRRQGEALLQRPIDGDVFQLPNYSRGQR